MPEHHRREECLMPDCTEHSGVVESVLGLKGQIKLLIWLMGANGLLLSVILGVLLSNLSQNAVQSEQILELKSRLTQVEMKLNKIK